MYHYFISFIKLFYTRKYFQCFRRRKQLDAYIPRNGCLKYVLFSGRHCVQNMQRVNIFFCSAKKKNLCKENLGTKPNPTIRSIFLKNETLSEELDKWLKVLLYNNFFRTMQNSQENLGSKTESVYFTKFLISSLKIEYPKRSNVLLLT